MQVSIETTSGLERRLTVGVPADRVDSEVNQRLQEAAKTIRLDGFRPGKVPMRVVRQRFGADVRQEVLGEIMSQSFYEAVNQENLKPAGQPSIEPKTLEEGKDIEFVATFEVFPDIELVELADLKIERPQAEIDEEDLETMIQGFRKQQGSYEDVERDVQADDKVNIDYAGTRDGEAFDGGNAEASDLTIGSNSMIPGFEGGIVGMKIGDEKVLSLTFPEDYHSEELKGASVEFKIKVNSIKEQVLAEMDDEFFAKFGVSEGGEDNFREEITKNMQRELKNAIKATVKQQVMDGVVAAHDGLDVPAALIDQEISAMRRQMFQQFGGAGAAPDLDLDSLLPADMFQEEASKRVKLGLILNAYISKQSLKADADTVRQTIEEMAATYQDPEEVINHYYSNKDQLSSIESMVLEDQIVEKMLESADITENVCNYQQVLEQARAQKG
jgi:trigger factor